MMKRIPLALLAIVVLGATACSKDPEVAKREHEKSGDAYVAQQKPREAIVEYRNAVGLDPRWGEVRLKLAEAYLSVNETQNALQEIVRAADLMPSNAQAQLKAGQLLLLSRQFEEARSRADKALLVERNSVEAQILKGSALAGMKDLDGAIALMEQAIRDDPARGLSYANLGVVEQAQGRTELAEKSFLRAVQIDPKSVAAHLALANFYWSTNRRKEAEAAIDAVLTQVPNDVRANRVRAFLHLAAGQIPEAEQRFKALAAADPSAANLLTLGDFYLAARKTAEAKAAFEKAAADPKGFVPAQLKLAALSATNGDRADATRRIDEILARNGTNGDALALRAEVQLADQKVDEALKSVQAAVKAAPGSASAQFLMGRILTQKGDTANALKAFEEALKLAPKLAPAAIEVAKARLAAGKPDDAIQFATTALQSAPSNSDARLVLARAQIMKRDSGAAEETLKSLAADFPSAAAVQTDLGRVYLGRDNTRARQAFERAWTSDKRQVGALEGLAALDILEKKPQAARARVDAALAAAPNAEDVHLTAARLYGSMKDFKAAENALKRVLVLNPNSLAGFTSLGQLYAATGRLPEATAQFERIAATGTNSPAINTILGILLQLQNRPAEAKARYSKALEADPRAAVAANNLAWTYAENGENLDQALQLAQTAVAVLPNESAVRDTLGWVYCKKQLWTLALPLLEQNVREEPKNGTYHYRLGLAQKGLGDIPAARRSMAAALALPLAPAEASDAKRILATLR
jgi:tetratricopeptide (TPR) repeat protein